MTNVYTLQNQPAPSNVMTRDGTEASLFLTFSVKSNDEVKKAELIRGLAGLINVYNEMIYDKMVILSIAGM